MIQIERNREKTDRAWNKLYDRLDNDGLLSQGEGAARRRRFDYWKWGMIAAAFIAGCVYLLTGNLMSGEAVTNRDLMTQNNEEPTTLVTTLEDGSVVYLGNETRLQYPEHFQTGSREVHLAGNALFDIAPNRERPFIVETNEVRIEVLGTAFNVKSNVSKPFELSVKRGKVRVTLKANGQQADVKAGETVTLLSRRLHLSDTKDISQFDKYTRQFRFKDQRLADILRVINLNETGTSLQTTTELGERLLTVSFSENSPESMVNLICMALNLKYICKQDTILIYE